MRRANQVSVLKQAIADRPLVICGKQNTSRHLTAGPDTQLADSGHLKGRNQRDKSPGLSIRAQFGEDDRKAGCG